MNNTEATEWIDKARPMVEFIEANGGPEFPNWCDLDGESINEYDRFNNIGDSASCPPAVVAAICMWANDHVFIWFLESFEHLAEEVFGAIEPDYVIGGYSIETLKTLTAICESLGYTKE